LTRTFDRPEDLIGIRMRECASNRYLNGAKFIQKLKNTQRQNNLRKKNLRGRRERC